ncbi:hypothetical protein HO133_004371 [Letharia lupina]|uniref:Uncharacterized protein n=1 Tax=Letharia lupina TaxID=560253 RepID=A0A8H6FK51_9LECA|nr:uncharacterized protein HO133_004371 [Letharia lupina]KAF6230033.1 hypothetical protein HO133_004371 [Letharia lupina]
MSPNPDISNPIPTTIQITYSTTSPRKHSTQTQGRWAEEVQGFQTTSPTLHSKRGTQNKANAKKANLPQRPMGCIPGYQPQALRESTPSAGRRDAFRFGDGSDDED